MSKVFTVDLDTAGLQAELYKRIDLIYEAVCDAQAGWMKRVALSEVNRTSNEERTHYELRVEYSGPSFVIRWCHFQFVRHGNKKTRVVKSLAIPENGKYKKSQFKKAQPWELDLIMAIEESISPYRVQLKHLMKAHQSIMYLSKSSGRTIKAVPIKERVTKPNYSIANFKDRYRK
jgi:hypothetical protein